ncbi:GAP family protein [Mycobacterium interjectum]|uniref:GAP family protein n=1 Tax=Mycobacterium interjectum TaxID=33895 RepID=UPI00082CF32F|nr:GAP family protein [Mycobacterium interjectum]MCV7093151.1 GAP family protein [Mycobacterium interjectum]
MWGTVLALALVAGVDPGRIGIAVLLFSRRRPVLHLVALWLGGIAVGVVLALGALVGLHDVVLGVMDRVELATSTTTAGRIQIAMGVFALLVAALIAIGFSLRQPAAMPSGGPPSPAAPTAFSRLSTRAIEALRAGPPWITFLVGVGITTDFRYLAALTVILASGAALGTQVSAAAAYTLVGLAFAEIPLVCQVAAPARTGAVMARVHDWVQARRRAVLGLVVAALGVFLMTTGMGHV